MDFWVRAVTLVVPSMVDVRGTLVADWSDPVRTNVDGCEFQSARGGRDFELGASWVRVYRVWLPEGTVVPAGARVELEDVEGQFSIIDGPHVAVSALESLGMPGGTSHVSMTVGVKREQ